MGARASAQWDGKPSPAGWLAPLGNVQCGRSTQENREVLVVKVGRGSPEGRTVRASSMAKGLRAAVDPCIGRVDPGRPVGRPALPMGTDRAKHQRNAAFPRPRLGRRPWGAGGAVSFPFPSDN